MSNQSTAIRSSLADDRVGSHNLNSTIDLACIRVFSEYSACTRLMSFSLVMNLKGGVGEL